MIENGKKIDRIYGILILEKKIVMNFSKHLFFRTHYKM